VTYRHEDGWALTCSRAHAQGLFPVPGKSWRLDGLRVTPEQAQAITSSRGWTLSQWTFGYPDEQATTMSGIQLTAQEADALMAGASPLAVLLPVLRLRALTLREMMTGEPGAMDQ